MYMSIEQQFLHPVSEPHPEEPKKPEVPQAVFEATMRGNRRVPQVLTGIGCYLANAVLSEEGLSFEDFFESELSAEQIEEMKAAMNRAHAARNIAVRSVDAVGNEEEAGPPWLRLLDDQRFKDLWVQEKNMTLRLITSILYQIVPMSHMYVTKADNTKLIQEVERLLSDESKKEQRALLHRVISSAVRAYESEGATQLLMKYRSIFDNTRPENSHRSGKYELGEDYEKQRRLDELREYIIEDIARHNPDFKYLGINFNLTYIT
jgi:hypothetical protein